MERKVIFVERWNEIAVPCNRCQKLIMKGDSYFEVSKVGSLYGTAYCWTCWEEILWHLSFVVPRPSFSE